MSEELERVKKLLSEEFDRGKVSATVTDVPQSWHALIEFTLYGLGLDVAEFGADGTLHARWKNLHVNPFRSPTQLELAIAAEQNYRKENRIAPFAERPDAMHLETIKEPLKYVFNTSGHATLEHFKSDYEPIGTQLWVDMHSVGAVRVNSEGRIIVTELGKLYLEQLSK